MGQPYRRRGLLGELPRDPDPDRDQRARFQELYQAHFARILGYAMRRGASAEDAADVVAETFLVAWRRLEQVPSGEAARPWIYGVARRVMANHRRGALRQTLLAARLAREITPFEPSPPNDGVDALAAFRALRPADREILGLASWEGLGTTELAAALGCSPNAAKIRLHRARRRLARELVRLGVDVKPDRSSGHVHQEGVTAPPEVREVP
jgi:RNA polymerase sigma factor (sigma-70 family)